VIRFPGPKCGQPIVVDDLCRKQTARCLDCGAEVSVPDCDLYEVLQVSPNADLDIIEAAYKRLASKWHPDRNPGDVSASERMKLISAAYTTLSDPNKRRKYDSKRINSGGVRAAAENWEEAPSQDETRPSSTAEAHGQGNSPAAVPVSKSASKAWTEAGARLIGRAKQLALALTKNKQVRICALITIPVLAILAIGVGAAVRYKVWASRPAQNNVDDGIAGSELRDRARQRADSSAPKLPTPNSSIPAPQTHETLLVMPKSTDDLPNAMELQAIFNRGKEMLQKKEYDRAIEELGKLIKINPQHVAAYVARGEARSGKNQHGLAIKDFDEAIRCDSKSTFAYVNRAHAWSKLGQFEKAVKDSNTAIQIDPNCAAAYFERGGARSGVRDFKAAIGDYDRAILLDPKSPLSFCYRAFARSMILEYDEALKDYDEAIQLDQKCVTAFAGRAAIWGFKGEYDKQIKDCDTAIELEPTSILAHLNRAAANYHKRDYAKAIKDWDEVIRLDPKSVAAYHYRGITWHMRQYCEEALKDLNEAIRLDPGSAPTYADRALAYFDQGKFDAALKDANEAIRLDAKGALSYRTRAVVWHGKKAYDNAIKDFREALSRDANCVLALDGLAFLLATCPESKYRDGKQAVELACQACKLTGWKSGYELAILAAAFAESGDFPSAIAYGGQALGDPAYQGKAGDEFRKRLELYKKKTPYRWPAGIPATLEFFSPANRR
jgi:tetratricopeptide (TPR) repeat protein